MICCKIIADYNNTNGHLQKLCGLLSQYGDWLWNNNTLFFSECDTNSLTEKKIYNIVKRSGYSKCFIDIYDQSNQPNESDDVNIWLTNRLIRINYNMCENKSQEIFHNIANGLDMIDLELQQLRDTKIKEQQEAELENGQNTDKK